MRRALVALGVLVIAFAMVWLYLIFPGMAKLPADYSVTYHFEGQVQVFNQTAGTLVPIATKMDRILKGTEINADDALVLKQDITFFLAANGAPLSSAPGASTLAALDSHETYAIDRTTRVNLAGGDKTRSGQFTFPLDVQKETYQYWVATTNSTLPATFVGEETVDGLKVYVFNIDSKGNTSPTSATQRIDVAATIKVEPVSGTPVDSKLTTTVNQLLANGSSMAVLINESHFTQATIDEMVTEGKANMNKIMWASVYGFWGAIALGAVLVILGLVLKSKPKAA
ncbi:porin PorA family protein [Dehalogenimonas etheniformans]|uniref:DUF3068 domain-containing protein n=1 Tax=Dehalogenimonas etheniformans TaxID=1536648 RepID=A0A2P5P8Z8_9CHLR|nr:porin PorA family protein [Dehalogenimonas etheniformans]PPD58769.1 DUF3068 domain-containing protein [Dehalogenimonas etheniformans]QNT76460.1 DUF3068 domain-containing protein [Dehalogenimonas etheniformans]